MDTEQLTQQLDPVFKAQWLFRQHKWDDCIALCTELLAANPYDQAVWYLKCRALTLQAWVDDTDFEEEGMADSLLDENATATLPRPGTSLSRPMTGTAMGTPGMRPISSSGRPLSGYARPGTGSARPGTQGGIESAMQGARPGTSRPVTALGRLVRLGTASMVSEAGGPFIRVERLDLKKYAARPELAKVLFDYILYHDHNPRKALELANYATQLANFEDWWWKERLGKCYYMLGLLREAEKQFASSIRNQPMVVAYLQLAKVALRLDQPKNALDVYTKAIEAFPGDPACMLGIARVHEALNEETEAIAMHKMVLEADPANVEAMACLAAHHFYSDQPELALRFYRRMLQMGVSTPELWNNLGLCCFYASQYDMALSCLDRALSMASDDAMADVWYNIGQVAIGIGDLGLAYQAFKISISVDANHAESYSNLGVLELRKGNIDAARSNFRVVQGMASHLFEPFFNGALLAYKLGDFQEAFELATKALQLCEGHHDSLELLKQLKTHFAML
ncbi:trp protein for ciliary function [Chrysochromulina tobinii]|uniref:Trp protein for ciliary function n=1 Tax=Chrysochromulina tobinii TaxID=1460289 RepID=A0A0M0K752_9EUKA|nr:trp protein for ciliary function [Chrysochromulina tobinii]|eukprot:KOO34701.1 trp protein for ciliary function [Chrysochromulina sp. CCMP291]